MKSVFYSGLVAFFATALLVSCGEDKAAQKNPSGGVKTISGVKYTDGVAKDGTPRLLFENELPGGNAKNKVGLEFTLKDGGTLTASLNVTRQLEKGINIEFHRVGKILRAFIIGTKRQIDISVDVNDKLGPIDGNMKVVIRIHNDEGDAHVLLEDINGKKVAEVEEAKGPGRGQGTYWMVGQKDASLISLPVVPVADKE